MRPWSLVPAPLRATSSIEEYMTELPKYDAEMSAQVPPSDSHLTPL